MPEWLSDYLGQPSRRSYVHLRCLAKRSLPASGCLGFRSMFSSSGTIIEGTTATRLAFESSHAVPQSIDISPAGSASQPTLAGSPRSNVRRAFQAVCGIVISTRYRFRGSGAEPLKWTSVSRHASARDKDVYSTGVPSRFHRLHDDGLFGPCLIRPDP